MSIRFAKKAFAAALLCCLGFTMALRGAEDSADALSALIELLGSNDDPQFQLDVLKGMSDGLKGRREVKMPTGWEKVADKLGKSPNAQVRELSQSLSVTFGSASALAALRDTLANPNAGVAARSNALTSLLQAKDAQLPATLQRLLNDSLMRASALRGLAAYDDAKTSAAILEMYPSLSAMEKKDALNTLASRAVYARALLDAVGVKKIAAQDLTADLVRQLRNLKDTQINEQVEKNWGVSRETEADKLAEIARFKKLITTKGYGDPRRGRAVFARTCQQCHTLFGEGGKVAPDITGSNRADLDYILHNAVDPNAVIPNDYRTSNIETKDERTITGIVTKQDDNALTVVTANETLVVPRNELQSVSQTELSMMPEGLLQAITEDEVRALLAYLRSPAQVPLPADAK
ncbi:MAG TPA: c-type cytochrome [Candidatus Limnocylindria bacterium]|nr:c-type cytochrome [Candidatus Limnocylindria bacterium]